MDFGDLIILLLFLAPALSRLFGKKQPKPKPAPPSDHTTPRQIEDPLAEALRQIREAMGEDEVTEAEPEPVTTKPTPRPVPLPRAKEFRPLGEFEHERHGFGRENPLSEQSFENRPAFIPATEPIQQTVKEVDLTTPIKVTTPSTSPSPSGSLAHLLRDPQRAREAFILYEVLGPPKSRPGRP